MSESLGLSIGMTNLVAARVGEAPVSRRAVLTLYQQRPPEVGVPAENPDHPTEPGVVLSGFVERVGDPVPLVAEDGSTHKAERVLVEALDAMADIAGSGQPRPPRCPSRFLRTGAPRSSARCAVRCAPCRTCRPTGFPPALIPDSTAALTALQANPGLPTSGVVALLDFGGSGTSISLADAGTGLEPIGETVRLTDVAGEQIDQAVLTHVLDVIANTGSDRSRGHHSGRPR